MYGIIERKIKQRRKSRVAPAELGQKKLQVPNNN